MNLYERMARQIGRTGAFGWLGPRLITPLDQFSHARHLPDSTFGTTLPLVYLTTKGRRSGLDRTVPLLGIPSESGSTVVAGTNWGRPNHPDWVHNLRSNPQAVLERSGITFQVVARSVAGAEHDRYWSRFTTVWPGYEGYRARAPRSIPLFVLEEP